MLSVDTIGSLSRAIATIHQVDGPGYLSIVVAVCKPDNHAGIVESSEWITELFVR